MDHYDIVIIGGGLTGAASAYHLARGGASVLLVDRADLNRGASGRNAGSLHFQLEHRLIEHGDAQVDGFARIIPLNQAAMVDWANLEAELDADLQVTMKGGLMLAESDQDISLLERKDALERAWGMPTRLLTGAEARQQAPYLADSVKAAAFCETEGYANPRLVTPAFVRAAMANGAVVQNHTAVRGLEPGAEWRVHLEAPNSGPTVVRASRILNAAGSAAGHIAAMANLHFPIFALPLIMNVTATTAPFIPHLIQHAGKRLSLKQVRDGNVLIGGGWSARFEFRDGLPDFTSRPRIDPDRVRQNITVAAEVVPALGRLQHLRTWSGVVGITSDQLPILGEAPEAPGFYTAAGGSGFTLGPTYGRLMAAMILGGTPSLDIAPYSPSRFSHLNMFMGVA